MGILPSGRAVASAVLVALAATACSTPPSPRVPALGPTPNVVLLTVDTLRADRIGAWGYRETDTPQMDRLAAEGTRFANAISTVPFTLPAHSAIMTGTYPPWHGVRENVGYSLGDEAVTLAETFRDQGYATAGFVSAFPLDSRWGIAQGFDHYLDDFDVTGGERTNMGAVQRPGAETIAAVLGWLDERPDAPFFVWVHLFEPHDPYTPPEPYRSRYAGRPYDGEVAYTDFLVGELRGGLEERGLLDSAVMVLTGDHGEGLGDHGEAFHGYFIYDSTVHVPLIVRLPGEAGGRVVDAAVSHVDLAPTLLELAGVTTTAPLHGRSLVPLLAGTESDADAAARAVYSESYYPLLHYGWAPLRSLRDAHFKYIDAPTAELFEVTADPGETRNLARERAATGFQMAEALRDLAASIEFEGEREQVSPDLDEATLSQLRALGYLAGRGEVDLDEEMERPDPKDKIELHQLIMAAQSDVGMGDDAAAEAKLRAVLARDAAILDANQLLASVLAERQQHQEALGYYQAALASDPEHQASLFGLASSYRALGQRDEALVGFRRLLELAPTDSKTVIAAAELLVQANDLVGAQRVVEAAVAAERVPPILYNQLGELLVLQGDQRGGEAQFRLAIDRNPELAQPRFNLGVMYEERGDLAGAMRMYREAIEHAPGHYQSLFNLGRLEGATGNVQAQQEHYEAAIAANPDFARGYFFLAKLLMDRGSDLRRAEELTRQGIERDPELASGPLGYYLLADLLNRQGRRLEAQQAAQRGREIEGR